MKAYFAIGFGRQKWARDNQERLQAEILSIENWNYDWKKWKRHVNTIRRYKTDVIIDHHMHSVRARKRMIGLFKQYEKIAVVLEHHQFQPDEVTQAEGFDHLWVVATDGSVNERW